MSLSPNRQAEIMMRIASEFGFTPASRGRLWMVANGVFEAVGPGGTRRRNCEMVTFRRPGMRFCNESRRYDEASRVLPGRNGMRGKSPQLRYW